MDYGFHALGLPLAFANDRKGDAGETYALNFGVPLAQGTCLGGGRYAVGDVGALGLCVGGAPPVLVLVGGPPCQDFSIMRGVEEERRGGLTLRGKLHLHYARFLALLRPAAFVFENVPGLLSSNGGRDFQAVLEDFAHLENLPRRWMAQHRLAPETTPPPPEDLLALPLGEIPSYALAFQGVVDASAHGVPQRRRRLILVGVRRDLPLTPEHRAVLAEAMAGSPALRKYPLSSMEALEGALLPDLEEEYLEVVEAYGDLFQGRGAVEDYLRLHGGHPGDPLFERAMEEHGRILEAMGWKGVSLSRVGEGAFPDGSHAQAKESRKTIERMRRIPPGGNHAAVRGTAHEVEGRGFSLVYRRLHPLAPSPTVVAHGGGGSWGYHYRRERSRLTNRERARLQGFPDGFVFRGNAQQVRAQIGEAVPPLLSLAVARALKSLLQDLGVRWPSEGERAEGVLRREAKKKGGSLAPP